VRIFERLIELLDADLIGDFRFGNGHINVAGLERSGARSTLYCERLSFPSPRLRNSASVHHEQWRGLWRASQRRCWADAAPEYRRNDGPAYSAHPAE
jgi:hypothetical protein